MLNRLLLLLCFLRARCQQLIKALMPLPVVRLVPQVPVVRSNLLPLELAVAG